MYTLIRTLSGRRFMLEQVPPLATAWLIAELFYKFKSFSLECAAFIATWYALDALMQFAKHLLDPAKDTRAAE